MIGGLAFWNAPDVVVSTMATSQPGSGVEEFAVASATDCAVVSAEAVSAVCTEKAMLAVDGICACQSNSRQIGRLSEGQSAMKSRLNVTGANWIPGVGGVQLSGDTQAERSNSMNSSAFSCGDRSPFLQESGNMLLAAEQVAATSPTQLPLWQLALPTHPWHLPETHFSEPHCASDVHES